MDKNIAILLAEIQLCSDNGKGLSVTKVTSNKARWQSSAQEEFYELGDLVGNSNRIKAISGGYALKDKLIVKACRRIARNPECGFKFWIAKDKNGIDVVYFQWKLDGEKHQCSFHRPNGFSEWKPGSEKSQCRWEKGLGSRKELIELLKSL